MKKTGQKKILAHHHTGKLRHHRHTSFLSLFIIMLLAAVPLFAVSRVMVSADAKDPVSASYTTYAVVQGEAPKVAPSISNQSNGKVYTIDQPVIIKGSCTDGSLVKIFKNEVFAGAAYCQNGSYQIPIDLFVGNNSLIARAYNSNDAASPDSTPISVQLVLPGNGIVSSDRLNVLGAPAGQFYMTSEVSHRGANVGDTMTWPLAITGGVAPYAVSISWGDGKTDLISRGEAGTFNISHAYGKASSSKQAYTIVIKSTDQSGNTSFLQLAALVSDGQQGGIVGTVKGGYNWSGPLRLAWQLLGGGAIVALSFWLGERREARILRGLTKRTA